METTRLSSKGQVTIPKPVRTAHRWETGQEFVVIDAEGGVLLRPKSPFRVTDISEVASCLEYSGEAKSVDEMEAAIKKVFRTTNDVTLPPGAARPATS